MDIIEATFGKPRVLLPVIHTLTEMQVVEQVGVAVENGADGVFLIDQHMHWMDVLEAVPVVRKAHPTLKWVGVNILAMNVPALLNQIPSLSKEIGLLIDGIWSDSSGVGEDKHDSWGGNVEPTRDKTGFDGLWFGGIAFKYRNPVPNERIPELVKTAADCRVDVVTTTGAATGSPADLGKVQAFREALGDRPLALASGITPENVSEYLPSVQAFLVASGIERKFGVLDPARVKLLADRIHAV